MQLVDSIIVRHPHSERAVSLYVGDLATLPAHEAVDVLVVSAFPSDYLPTRGSLIGALHRADISVAELAEDKEVDLRQFFSCWLSRPIGIPGVNFRRVLCFEPLHRGRASEIVGDIFRSIVPFTTGTPPISQIAMPLVASGDQGENDEVMLESLVEASVHWLSAGLTLDRIKIVLRDSHRLAARRELFAHIKRRHFEATAPFTPIQFDLFVSYSHVDRPEVEALVADLRTRRPRLRVFLDRLELRTGAAWQQHIAD